MTTSADPPGVVDTNVLVYLSDTSSPHHLAASTLCKRGERGELVLYLTPQIVLEYVSVVTNPKRVAAPLTMEQAWGEVAKFLRAFRLIQPPPDLIDQMIAFQSLV